MVGTSPTMTRFEGSGLGPAGRPGMTVVVPYLGNAG